METFKHPELSDRQWVTGLLAKEGSRACEHNFASIFLWATAYPQQIARVGDRLLVQMLGGPGLSHLFPMGAGPLAPALEAAKADAAAHGVPMTLICITAEQKAQLEAEFPGRFVFQEDRDGYDYLYTVDKLADLAGKKLHAKRNHISRFCDSYPDWLFEPITADNIADCKAMEKEWFAQQVADERADRNLDHERQAVLVALDHTDELGLTGGLIRAEGRVLAFSLGSLTTADCYNIHFEKAFGDIQGAYAVINREMARWARNTWPELKYLNREDDMGLEGLRKAKLSYYPDLMLEKYSAREAQ
jgi:hypothetical protein